MEHRVGAGTHRDVEGHGVEESLTGGDATGQDRLVTIFVVGEGVLDNDAGCILEELYAVLVCGQNAAIAGQRESDSFGQGVHRIGGEHTRAGTTAWAGHLFHLCQFLVADGGVATLNHSRDKVCILAVQLVRFHRATAHEYSRDVQAHSSHQHTGCHLVAIGDADHCICFVGVDHVLHRVCDDVARG